jgi:hypothetical protein
MNLSFELTGIVTLAVIGIVWLVRLEAQGNWNKEKIKEAIEKIAKLEEKHEALENKIVDKLSFIERSLAKIEGRLSIDKGEKP